MECSECGTGCQSCYAKGVDAAQAQFADNIARAETKGRAEGIDAVEKELKKQGIERKQINETDGYIEASEMIDRVEEAIAAARRSDDKGGKQ